MRPMIAYCGLDCEKCDAYIATKNNDDELRIKTAAFWTKMNHVPITKEMINCAGCRGAGVKTPFCESLCKIRQCALKKSVTTCGDCAGISTCKIVSMILENNEEAKKNLLK